MYKTMKNLSLYLLIYQKVQTEAFSSSSSSTEAFSFSFLLFMIFSLLPYHISSLRTKRLFKTKLTSILFFKLIVQNGIL